MEFSVHKNVWFDFDDKFEKKLSFSNKVVQKTKQKYSNTL